jgi:uncharacterized protein YraI
MNHLRWLLLGLLVLSFPLQAQEVRSVRTTKWINLRAGPGQDPVVERLSPDTYLTLQGCTDGFNWCDVIASSNLRGWVYAGNISSSYQNVQVPVINYGIVLGLPVITFVIGNYWGDFYRGRPWYGNQSRYINRPRPVPRPQFNRPLPSWPHSPTGMNAGPGNGRPNIGRPPNGGRPGEHSGGRSDEPRRVNKPNDMTQPRPDGRPPQTPHAIENGQRPQPGVSRPPPSAPRQPMANEVIRPARPEQNNARPNPSNAGGQQNQQARPQVGGQGGGQGGDHLSRPQEGGGRSQQGGDGR